MRCIKRYENKEALFDALVEPTLVLIEEYSNQTETFNYNQLEKKDMETVWKIRLILKISLLI